MGMIFLVRHGRTAWNREEVFRGTFDIPLDDFGRKQAREVGRKLRSLNLNHPLIFSSPLARAFWKPQRLPVRCWKAEKLA